MMTASYAFPSISIRTFFAAGCSEKYEGSTSFQATALVWSPFTETGASPCQRAAQAIMSIAIYPTIDVDPLLVILSEAV